MNITIKYSADVSQTIGFITTRKELENTLKAIYDKAIIEGAVE